MACYLLAINDYCVLFSSLIIFNLLKLLAVSLKLEQRTIQHMGSHSTCAIIQKKDVLLLSLQGSIIYLSEKSSDKFSCLLHHPPISNDYV